MFNKIKHFLLRLPVWLFSKLPIKFFCLFKNTTSKTPLLEFAFWSGGRAFFKFKSDFDMPVERALSAKDVYTELECGVDKEYLNVYFETIEALADKGKLSQIATLTSLAKSRLTHISNAMLLYKLASVVYVTTDEDPYKYDWEQAEKKIAFWIKNEDVGSFFLKNPMSAYIQFLQSAQVNIKDYFQAQGKEISQILEYHLNILSEMPEKKHLYNLLAAQLKVINLLKV